MARLYYSVRSGLHPNGGKYSLNILSRLFIDLYLDFKNKGFFDEYFGKDCVDSEYTQGKLGMDVGAKVFRYIKKDNLWPIEEKYLSYTEDDLFDIMEFLFDHISSPLEQDAYFHSYAGCGWHYEKYDQKLGQSLYRDSVNELLSDYEDGFRVSSDGEIELLPESGLNEILDASVPSIEEDNIVNKIEAAKKLYLLSRSGYEDRRTAVRELADVLEYLRPRVKELLTKRDEADLFELANRYSIRHHDGEQKRDYDSNIWLSWMFYYYLATIHTVLRLKDKYSTN